MKCFVVRALTTLSVLAIPAAAMHGGGTAAATEQESSSPLVGGAASKRLIGNTISGTTADGPYADFLAPDGTAMHLDGEGRESGKWTMSEGSICFSFPADPDERAECRRVEIQGTRGVFIDTDGSRYPFDILPGNAKNL